MSNMSYCRMENTYHDLCDCENALCEINDNEENDLSESEMRYADKLYHACQSFITEYETMQENNFYKENDDE